MGSYLSANLSSYGSMRVSIYLHVYLQLGSLPTCKATPLNPNIFPCVCIYACTQEMLSAAHM